MEATGKEHNEFNNFYVTKIKQKEMVKTLFQLQFEHEYKLNAHPSDMCVCVHRNLLNN